MGSVPIEDVLDVERDRRRLLREVEQLRVVGFQAKDALESILVRKDLDWQARAVRALHELSRALS